VDGETTQTLIGIGANTVGDNNRVEINHVEITLGGAKLTLSRLHKNKRVPTTIRELLLTDARATTLIGGTRRLDDYAAWLAAPDPIAVRCLIGPGGAGKTRFAVELCERAEATGWDAGFVTADELTRFHQTQGVLNALQPTKPTLLVIDYAAAKTATLRKWLDAAATAAGGDKPVRFLLLERHADAEAGWWSELRRPTGGDRRDAGDLLYGVTPDRLQTDASPAERRALVAEVMGRACLMNTVAPPRRPPAEGGNPAFDRRLSADGAEGGPLYLMMTAVAAVGLGMDKAAEMSGRGLAAYVAGLEAERLRRLGREHGLNDDADFFLHLAACVTLQGGCGAAAAGALIDEERSAWSIAVRGEKLRAWLIDALPDGTGGVAAIAPDLIGEAFALSTLRGEGHPPAEQAEIVERAWRRAGAPVVETVVRTLQDHSVREDDVCAKSCLAWLDRLIEAADTVESLTTIANAMPLNTTALRERACKVETELLRRLGGPNVPLATARDMDGEADIAAIATLAGRLNNLAVRLGELGRREEALAAARQAVDLRRELAARRPDAFNPNLAASLNNLAKFLSELGRREEALDAARQAVDLRRELAARRPDAFNPDLAMSLNNLAKFLSELGRREEALDAARQAVDLYRELAAHRPDAFNPNLAASLNNLAKFLSELGRREEALDAARQAVDLYRELAAHRPDAFNPNLAMSLNNLANFLSELGRREEALDAARQAVDLCRELAAHRPDAFNPNLAASLNNLANRLSELGRREEALDAARQAVDLRRELAAHRPDAFNPNLAASLNNLAKFLSELGRREEALDAARQAVDLRRELAAHRPDAFNPDLAGSLNNLAAFLSELGRREEALDAARQAVDLYRELAAHRPDTFNPNLAASLNNLAAYLSELGRREEALDAARQAVDLRRELAARRPDAFNPDLAGSLNNLANALSELGRREEALDAARQAVDLYRELAARRPDAFNPHLARSLWVLADRLDETGDAGGGLGANREAVAVLSPHFRRLPAAFAAMMAEMIRGYVERCEKAGEEPDGELLAPLIEVFQSFQTPGEGEET